MLLRVLTAAALAASLTGGTGRSGTGVIRGLDLEPLGLPGSRGGFAGPSWMGGCARGRGCCRLWPPDGDGGYPRCDVAWVRLDPWLHVYLFLLVFERELDGFTSVSSALTVLSGARGRRASSVRVGLGGMVMREDMRGGALQ